MAAIYQFIPKIVTDIVPATTVYVVNRSLISTNDGITHIDYIEMDYANFVSRHVGNLEHDAVENIRGSIFITTNGTQILIADSVYSGTIDDKFLFSVFDFNSTDGFTLSYSKFIKRSNPIPNPEIIENYIGLANDFGGSDYFVSNMGFTHFQNNYTWRAYALSAGSWSSSGISSPVTNTILSLYNDDLAPENHVNMSTVPLDIRVAGIPRYSGYGELLIAQFHLTGTNELRIFKYNGNSTQNFTFYGSIAIPGISLVWDYACDRNSGDVVLVRSGETYKDLLEFYKVDRTTGNITSNGSVLMGENIECVGMCKGYLIIFFEYNYITQKQPLQSYTWDGTNIVKIDAIMPLDFGIPSLVTIDPYSNFIWFTGDANGGIVEILDTGVFGRIQAGFVPEAMTNPLRGNAIGHFKFLPKPLGDGSLPIERLIPYSNTAGTYINFGKTIIKLFKTVYGDPDGPDFNRIEYIGGVGLPTAARIVNNLVPNVQMSFIQDPITTAASMLLVDSYGTILDEIHYDGSGDTSYITLPIATGIYDYWVVTHSASKEARIKKFTPVV